MSRIQIARMAKLNMRRAIFMKRLAMEHLKQQLQVAFQAGYAFAGEQQRETKH